MGPEVIRDDAVTAAATRVTDESLLKNSRKLVWSYQVQMWL